MTKTNHRRLISKISTFALIAALSFSVDANAGFEWHGPNSSRNATQGMVVNKTAKPKPMTAPQSADVEWQGEDVVNTNGEQLADLMPVQMTNEKDVAPAAVETVTTDEPTADELIENLAEIAHKEEMAAAEEITSNTVIVADNEEVIEGFASDISFVIALRQVIPTSHQFSFGSGVDLGQQVSWQGGQDWRLVLEEMISPLGLSAEIRDGLVVIAKGQSVKSKVSVIDAPMAAKSEKKMTTFVEAKPAGDDMTVIVDQVALTEGNTVAEQNDAPVTLLQKDQALEATEEAKVVKEADKAVAVAEVEAVPPTIAAETSVEENQDTPKAEVSGESMQLKIVSGTPWQAKSGSMLKDVLQEWSEKVGVELYWTIDYDYEVIEEVALNGSYQQAVAKLLIDFETANPQPYGQLHNGSHGPAVLIIKSYDTEK